MLASSSATNSSYFRRSLVSFSSSSHDQVLISLGTRSVPTVDRFSEASVPRWRDCRESDLKQQSILVPRFSTLIKRLDDETGERIVLSIMLNDEQLPKATGGRSSISDSKCDEFPTTLAPCYTSSPSIQSGVERYGYAIRCKGEQHVQRMESSI